MSEPPLLRHALAEDWPALLDLWEEAWSAALPQIDFSARRRWMSDRLSALDQAGAVIVLGLDEGGFIAGFITVDPGTGCIDQLAVRLALQGRGWAKLLLHHAQVLSPAGLHLSVNQANETAIRLYRREGFVITEAGTNELSGHPVWHMSRPGSDLIKPAGAGGLLTATLSP